MRLLTIVMIFLSALVFAAGAASAQVNPAPPSQPNLGYSSVICSAAGTAKYVEANIWIGVSKTDPANVRFLTECLPCQTPAGCQNLSVSQSLDPNYTWRRSNAGCFTPALPSENVSLTALPPHEKTVENSGGCSSP